MNTKLSFPILEAISPNKWEIPWSIKTALGCISKKPIVDNGEVVIIRGNPLDYHDLYHLEVAKLDRIQIGEHQVSGIHGINSTILHESPIVEEYDGIFDEIRVAFHEFIVKTSIYNTVKAIAWIGWLILRGINPAAVIGRHYKSIKAYEAVNPDGLVVRNYK